MFDNFLFSRTKKKKESWSKLCILKILLSEEIFYETSLYFPHTWSFDKDIYTQNNWENNLKIESIPSSLRICSTWFLIKDPNEAKCLMLLNASSIIPRVSRDYKSTVLRKRRGCSRWEMQIRWRNNLWACKLSGKVGRSRARCKPRARTDSHTSLRPEQLSSTASYRCAWTTTMFVTWKSCQPWLERQLVVAARIFSYRIESAKRTVLRASISVSTLGSA